MKFLATFIMKGRMQAMTVASVLALLSLQFPPISIVSSAAVALVTLRRGGKEGLYVLLCSCMAAALLSVLLIGNYQFALLYGLVLWLPVWLIAIVLREGRQLTTAIEIAVLLGVVGVVGFYLFQAEPVQIWRGVLEAMIQPMLDAQTDVPPETIKQSAEAFAHYMTGFVAAGSVYGLLFGLFLARWWQALLYNPGGFKAEYLELRGRSSVAIMTLVIIVPAVMTSGTIADICRNVLVLMFVLYTFIGAAVLHSVFAARNSGRYMVPLLYVTLLIIPQITAVMMALCGLSDAWLDLRNKLKPNGA